MFLVTHLNLLESTTLRERSKDLGLGPTVLAGLSQMRWGGNAFSGLTDLVQSLGSGAAGGTVSFTTWLKGLWLVRRKDSERNREEH
jgi:hypothetical protein